MASALAPDGLKRNQLSWLHNGTCRGGGISQRTGWVNGNVSFTNSAKWSGLYQGGWMYRPDNAFPYLMLDIGGRTYQVRVDTDFSVVDVTIAGDANPANEPQHWHTQAEQFMVIQDGISEPLVWDGNVLQRANTMPGAQPTVPVGQAMDYVFGRLWVTLASNLRQYVGSDIVLGPDGTAGYGFRDSVLKFIENTYLAGGGAFTVPTLAGNIRAMSHTVNLDTALGESDLYVFTRNSIYATSVPFTRAEWITVKEPLQRLVQADFGTVSDRSVVPVNGDLFYQSIDGIRSFQTAVRYFHQYGQVPLSRNENRILRFNDRSLQRTASGINFDNRLWQTALPFATDVGPAFKAVIPLDFDLISSFEERLPPAWEGAYEGLDFLQLFEGDFGGRQRAFAVVLSRLTNEIEVWEMTVDQRFENGDNRVQWYFETPAYTWDNPFQLKRLESLELWIDKLFGTVDFDVYYRPNQLPCWIYWHSFRECQARDCTEDPNAIECDTSYPNTPYCEGFRPSIRLPRPFGSCELTNKRPLIDGYQFQLKVVIKGWARIRGLLVHAVSRETAPFEGMNCAIENGVSFSTVNGRP